MKRLLILLAALSSLAVTAGDCSRSRGYYLVTTLPDTVTVPVPGDTITVPVPVPDSTYCWPPGHCKEEK